MVLVRDTRFRAVIIAKDVLDLLRFSADLAGVIRLRLSWEGLCNLNYHFTDNNITQSRFTVAKFCLGSMTPVDLAVLDARG